MFAIALSVPGLATASPDRAQIEVGKRLFEDPRLSDRGTISCASCHLAEARFADPRPASRDVDGLPLPRNAPSLLDLHRHDRFFWDGRHASLSSAIGEPLTNPREHGFASLDAAFRAISGTPEYRHVLERPSDVTSAIESYLRSLPAAPNLVDRLPADGPVALGADLFRNQAGCARCHHELDQTPPRQDTYHSRNVAPAALSEALLAWPDSPVQQPGQRVPAALAPLGHMLVSGDLEDAGTFRTPSLVHAAGTPPYMHDGSIATLREAVVHEIYYSTTDQGAGFAPSDIDALVALFEWMDNSACAAYPHYCAQNEPTASAAAKP